MKLRLPLTITALLLGAVSIPSQAATIIYNFDSTTTAWTTGPHASAVDSNDFGNGITATDYTFTRGGSREIAIVDGIAKAKCTSGTDTHQFTINIPMLGGGQSVNLTGLSFEYHTTNYDQAEPFTSAPAGWTLNLSQGSASMTSGNPTTKTITTENLVLSGLTGLNDTSITFTLGDIAGGNNKNTTFWTGFDNIIITGEVVAPIPEPTTALFGAFGSLLLLRRRRN